MGIERLILAAIKGSAFAVAVCFDSGAKLGDEENTAKDLGEGKNFFLVSEELEYTIPGTSKKIILHKGDAVIYTGETCNLVFSNADETRKATYTVEDFGKKPGHPGRAQLSQWKVPLANLGHPCSYWDNQKLKLRIWYLGPITRELQEKIPH